jgi:hypothetical protein
VQCDSSCIRNLDIKHTVGSKYWFYFLFNCYWSRIQKIQTADFFYLKSSDQDRLRNNISVSDWIRIHNTAGTQGRQQQQRPKPVLCDPFWLENVVMSQEVVMTYTLGESRDLEAVLAADRARLKAMVQPPLVYAQLKELFSLVGDDSDGKNIVLRNELNYLN